MSSRFLSNYSIDQPQVIIERIIKNVEKVIVGKRASIEHAILAFLCSGHILLEDVPGVGKTMLVRALAKTIGCDFSRIQFTPDMQPSDVTGVSIFNRSTSRFEYRPGPLMANIVLADEINRTAPKTQAALLEAMEERHVTVDGTTYSLPTPFLLLATQNPLEFEGTYALPEAQLDRFFMKLQLGYPTQEQEADMLGRLMDRHPIEDVRTVVVADEIIELQKLASVIHVDDSLKRYIVSIASATRSHIDLQLGASPRASIALMRASQARAFMKGRPYVIPDDIKELVLPVFIHRLILSPEARMKGRTAVQVVNSIVSAVSVPNIHYAPAN